MSKTVRVDGRLLRVPDDATPEEIDSLSNRAGPVEPNPFTMFTLGARNRALSLLPSVGGAAGGIIGGLGGGIPGAAIGAGIGGSAGEAAREGLMGEPLSGGRIATTGAVEGGLQAVGGLAAKGAAKLARPIMRSALGVGKPIGGKVKIGSKLYDDPVETALLRGLEANEGGALKANALRKESGKALGSLVKAQTAAGKELSTREVTKYARAMLLDDALPVAEKKKVFNELVAFYREKGGKMTPDLTQRVKRYYAGIYKGWDKGTDPLTDPTRGAMAREMSRGAREALGPEVAAKGKEYAALKGAQKAVESAARKTGQAWEIQKPGTLPILKGLVSSRSKNSKLAIALADPGWQELYRQSPRLFAALVGQAMYSDEPDATAQ